MHLLGEPVFASKLRIIELHHIQKIDALLDKPIFISRYSIIENASSLYIEQLKLHIIVCLKNSSVNLISPQDTMM